MHKNILKNIAKDWCKGILRACDADAFGDLVDEGILTQEEAYFIVQQAHKIADRISKKPTAGQVSQILSRYYDIE